MKIEVEEVKVKGIKKVHIILIALLAIVLGTIITFFCINTSKSSKEIGALPVEEKAIQDVTPPVITLKGKKEITLKSGETYTEAGYSATDDNDGSVVKNVKVKKEEVSDKQYKIIYSVTDSSGNEAREERIVKTETNSTNNQTTTKQEETTKQETTTTKKENTTKTKKKNTTGVIYLTFDDGPSTSSTPKILDILKEENVKATFFILNYTNSTEYLVKRELEEGHAIGIHGYSHDYKKIYKSVDSYMENITKLQTKIEKSTGIKTTLTRFPGGSSNTISSFNKGIMTKLTKEVVKQGYQYFDWNVDSGDAASPKNSDAVYKNVVDGLYPDKNNIVLMHDFSGNTKTIDALKKIIQYGKENNYTFKALNASSPTAHHEVNN